MENKTLNNCIKAIFYIFIYIIGVVVMLLGGVLAFSIGVGIIIGETIFLFKKLIEFINKKQKKTKIIIYSISGIIFGLIFLILFILNTIEITTKYKEVKAFTQYSVGTITDILDNEIIISCTINGNEMEFNYDLVEDLEVGENVAIYFNPDDLTSYSLISPMLDKMLYLITYLIVTIPTFFLAKIPLTNLYYTFKPRREVDEVKVKK